MTEVQEKPIDLETPAIIAPRARLAAFQEVLTEVANLQGNLECPVEHYFTPGLYAREMFIPAGWCVIGKIHKTENFAILTKGHLRVFTETSCRDMHAGDTVIAQPGAQRAVYAFEDSKFIVVHPNPDNEKDVKVLEERFVVATFKEWEALCLTA